MKYAYRIFHITLLYALFTFREPHLQLLSQFICTYICNSSAKLIIFFGMTKVNFFFLLMPIEILC